MKTSTCQESECAVDGEHDLEFHNIYREYLSTFEGRIESFVKCAGGTAEESYAHETADRIHWPCGDGA